MIHQSRRQLLAGARPAFDIERKDTATLDEEVKKAVDQLGKTFADFREKNDQVIAEIKTGQSTAISKDELEKIGKGFEDLKAEVQKQLDEAIKKGNRERLSGSGDEAKEAKQAAAFGKLIGKADFSVENMREYKDALEGNLRNPEAKTQTLMVGADPAGGYWVTPDRTGRMVQKIFETTPMRQIANVVTIGTDRLQGAVDNG